MHRFAVVEDVRATNDEFRDLLLNHFQNCTVDQFFDRASAEAATKNKQYELVVVDVELGKHGTDLDGGFAILANLKGKPTVALVVSGASRDYIRSVSFTLEAWDFIQKPVSALDFINKTENALDWLERVSIAAPTNAPTTAPAAAPSSVDLQVDLSSRKPVTWKGEFVQLTVTEARIVQALSAAAGNVVDHSALSALLKSGQSKQAIAAHISGIRAAFRSVDPKFDQIQNEVLKGYYWKDAAN
jgi:DNA-binding response OmpR family regulator